MNRTAMLGLVFLTMQLAACGGDDEITSVPSEILPASMYEARCATPRTGIDPTTGKKFVDTKGNLLAEQLWLRSWIDDLYLWYSEVPVSDPKTFKTAGDYFDALRTPVKTASGKDKDQFHFTYVTSDWVALSQSGTEASYGLQWALLKTSPPRKLLVALVTPGSPAANAGMQRGTEVTAIDGVDLVAGSDTDTLNHGISPSDVNQTHTFVVRDPGATDTHTIMMTSANILLQPVQNAHTLAAPNDKVGYLLFTDHIATAEKGLVDAVTALKAQGITDLVIDIRYNGGGYLDIAAELAYMIAGPTPTAGKVFERESFNDKYQTVDPFSGMPLQPSRFIAATEGFSVAPGQALPHLDLPRVYVLTGSGTCSASEAVMNGLAGVGVQVIQIGATTCGKPYGFFPADNCGTTYFAIQFQGVNDKSFGDYADGFTPGGVNPGCVVADDFAHPLGDPAEGLLAAALAYRTNGTCPAVTTAAAQGHLAAPEPMVIPKPLWRQNAIATRHR